jgi:hypothetical protein
MANKFNIAFSYRGSKPLSTIVSHIVAVSFIGGGNQSTQRKPLTCKSLTNFIKECWIDFTSPWTVFELTTLVVIDTDCTCSCKPNKQTTTAPILYFITSVIHQVISYYYFSVSVTVGQFSFWQLLVVLCRYLNVQPISFWSVWKWFLQHEIQIMLSLFNNIYYYRLTRTLTSWLLRQISLVRMNGHVTL